MKPEEYGKIFHFLTSLLSKAGYAEFIFAKFIFAEFSFINKQLSSLHEKWEGWVWKIDNWSAINNAGLYDLVSQEVL